MRHIIINLARAGDRRAAMTAKMTALGLEFEFLEATDGRTLTGADRALVDNAARRRITAYPLSDNEIGCWHSHRRAMQNLLDSGQAMATIIEDDAILTPEFPLTLAAIEAHAPPFDVIDLHRNFKTTETFSPRQRLPDNVTLGLIGPMNMNLTAYIVSREGAVKFLSSNRRIVHAVDKDLHSYWKNGLTIYGLEHPVATQDHSVPSYIDETRHQDALKIRATYPAGNAPLWYLIRRFYKVSDSVQKRLAWYRITNRA